MATKARRTLALEGQRIGFEHLLAFKVALWAMVAGAVAVAALAWWSAGATADGAMVVLYVLATLSVGPMTALIALHVRGLNSFAGYRTAGAVYLREGELRVRVGRHVKTFALRDLAEGWVDPFDRGVVILRRRSGDLITFDTKDDAAAHRALVALGLATGQRTLRVRLASAASTIFGARLFGFVAILFAAPYAVGQAVSRVAEPFRDGASVPHLASAALGVGLGAATFGAVVFVMRYIVGEIATTGADGVTLRSLFGRRFVALADIRAVRHEAGRVRLELESGKSLSLPVTAATGELLASRVREALDRANVARVAAAKLERFDRRDDESIAGWRERLVSASHTAGYREVGLERDDFAAVLDDATCAPQRRIAAALALAGETEPAARERLRLAVDACANDELREALEHAAEGDLEERHLARLTR